MKKIHCRLLALLLAAVLLVVPVAAEESSDVVIVLDPGHGGTDSGAVHEYDGVDVYESYLNLKIAQSCRDYLEENYANVEVYLTREADVKVSLDDRVAFAVAHGADYMLSIHNNYSNGYADGALALVPRGRYRPEQAAASVLTAEAILSELEALGLANLGTQVNTNNKRYPDGSYKDAFAIVRGCVEANIPGIIMEHAFMDNEGDYRNFLSTDEKLAALGVADALGLASTLGLVEKPKNPTSADLGDTPFEDIFAGDWYYDDVTYVWNSGLMQGISGTEFGPALSANRAMVVTMLYRLSGEEYICGGSTFADVEEGSWYHAPVEWAYEMGITTGVSETEFAPNRSVIREQFVTFLHRYAGSPAAEAVPEHFADWNEVSDYARDAVAWAVEIGLVSGYDDGTVKPLRDLNRAELAVLIHRFHRWHLHEQGELVYEWTLSDTQRSMAPGEQFELTLMNQFGQKADPEWTADCEGVVEISGTTVTAVGEGTVLLSCEWDGEYFDCFVVVEEPEESWSISHSDVTIKVGETFRLRVRNSAGETADVDWQASKSGYVTINGNQITGKAKGTVTVSCEYAGQTFQCIVRVKSA